MPNPRLFTYSNAKRVRLLDISALNLNLNDPSSVKVKGLLYSSKWGHKNTWVGKMKVDLEMTLH